MHNELRYYCEKIRDQYPDSFKNKVVLDAGSLDINGCNKYLFEDCVYLGVDIAHGKNVDIVSPIHELNFRSEMFDFIISTSVFEHDVFYYLSLNNIVRMLKPGGMFLFTVASTGHGEHGTLRTTPSDSPNTTAIPLWANYYKNLDESDIRFCIDVDDIFSKYEFEMDYTYVGDLYFYGIKK